LAKIGLGEEATSSGLRRVSLRSEYEEGGGKRMLPPLGAKKTAKCSKKVRHVINDGGSHLLRDLVLQESAQLY